MGMSVHVAKTYKVEYAEASFFNWMSEEFISALNAIGADAYYIGNDGEYSNNAEVSKESFNNAINALEAYIKDNKATINVKSDYGGMLELDKEYLEDCIRCLDTTPEEFLKTLLYIKMNAEKECDYIHFSFF